MRKTVATRTLTWLTGSSANIFAVSAEPLANFFGFVALRVSSGQSLTRARVAHDTLAVLDAAQRDALAAIVEDQRPAHAETRAARLAMTRALEGLLVGEAVTCEDFLALGRAFGAAEGELGRIIAQGFGAIAQTLTAEQHQALALVRRAHAAGQPEQAPRPNARVTLPDVDRLELVNLAAQFLSWTTGTPAHNDFEMVGKPSRHFGLVSFRTPSARWVMAQEVLELLTADQRRMLDRAVARNVDSFDEFLAARSRLMRALEVALVGRQIDAGRVRTTGAAMGEIEASMTWAQARAMLDVRNSLDGSQAVRLLEMRTRYTRAGLHAGSQGPVALGRRLFVQCALCHAEGGNGIAPGLVGVLGRRIAGGPGYDAYSPAMQDFGEINGIWTTALLDFFLQSPGAAVPGTTMGFDGLPDEADRAAVTAYLATLD